MIKQYAYNNFDLLTSDEIIDTDKGNLKLPTNTPTKKTIRN